MTIARQRVWLVPLWTTLLAAGLFNPVAAAQERQKVVVLFGTRPDAQFVVVAQRQLASLLNRSTARGVDYYSEYMDVPRFADPDYQASYLEFLRLKYKAQHIDLVILTGTFGVEFTARVRAIFLEAPIVFYSITPPAGRVAGSTGLVNPLHFRGSLDLAMALQPDLEHVFVVSGAGPSDQLFEQQARAEFLPLQQRLDFVYLSGLATRDLEARLGAVPPHSAVFVVLVTRDGAGENFHEMDYLSLVAAAAKAPTYSWADAAVDSGIVGGRRRDHLAETQAIATVALQVLQGVPAEKIPVTSPSLDVNQVDWRQLRRWGISEARVPAGTTVLFREPGMWERYQRYIVGSLALILTQAALIAALLVQRSRRRSAEVELRRSHDRIRHLGQRLLQAQEAERSRVARELHDDISQQIAILAIELDSFHCDPDKPDSAKRLSRALQTTRSISSSVHALSHQLHPAPLHFTGLVSAINSLQRDFSAPHLSIVFVHRDVPTAIDSNAALCLFRVAQESLRNVVQHSGAQRVSINLIGRLSHLTLSVCDDGKGFDVNRVSGDGLGLISMRERVESFGGELKIHSSPETGTQVTASIPIPVPLTVVRNAAAAVHLADRQVG